MNIYLTEIASAAAIAQENMQREHVPGLAMAFIKNGELVMSQCLGIADTERGIPVSNETYFEAASLTKPFFGRLVFELADEGVIDLDRPLSEYEQAWTPCTDARFACVTAKDVMSHASGLPNWGKLPMELYFEPKHGFSYSGMGYYYLQSIIEKRLDTRLDDLMQKRLLDPFGMDKAALIWTGAMRNALARTVDVNGHAEPKRTTARHSMGMEPNSAFSLYVTIDDYPKFLLNILKEPDFAARVRSVRNCAGNGVGWGLGWGLYNERIWHWGDNGGFKSLVCFDPATRDALLIHTNGFNGLNVCFAVAEHVTGESFSDIAEMVNGAE